MRLEKKLGFDGKFTYGVENISTNKRNLMNEDEILKLNNNKEIVIVRGRKAFICNKYEELVKEKEEDTDD